MLLESKTKIGVTTHFSKIIDESYLEKALKYKTMYGVLSQIQALFSLKNAWLPHICFSDTSGTYKDLLSTDTFKPHKNITVFESITDRKTRVS